MIRVNLLPHREEKRKRRQQQFIVLAGVFGFLGVIVAGAVWLFLDQQVTQLPLTTHTARTPSLWQSATLARTSAGRSVGESTSTARSRRSCSRPASTRPRP